MLRTEKTDYTYKKVFERFCRFLQDNPGGDIKGLTYEYISSYQNMKTRRFILTAIISHYKEQYIKHNDEQSLEMIRTLSSIRRELVLN